MITTLVFEYRGCTYNESSNSVPRIGESILIGDIDTKLLVVDVVYDFIKRDIVYLTLKKKKNGKASN